MHWTCQEDELLRRNSHKGADWCRREIHKRFRIKRTKDAVLRHGYRIGCSFERFPILECPECHREFKRLVKSTGLCAECTAVYARDRQRQRKEAILANERAVRSESVERTRRECAAIRKWVSTHS